MKKINFPFTLDQIIMREHPEITDIFVKRVCLIHNKEANLDESFVKMWREFHKNNKEKFKTNSHKTIFREDWQ